MKKLLFVVNDAAYFFSHRLPLAKAVQDKGWAVHVAVPFLSEPVQERFQSLGMTPHEFIGSNGLLNEIKGAFKLIGTINTLDPELLHLITLKSSLRWFMTLFCTYKIKSLHTIAGFGQLAGRSIAAKTGKFAMKIILAVMCRLTPSLYIVQNPADAAELCRHHVIPPERLFMVQGSGVDTELYKPAPRDAKKNVLHLGSACRRLTSKGLPALMALARTIKNENLPVHVHVASIPVPVHHREAISEADWRLWKSENLFIDEGQVTDMPAYYQSLDAFIYLSTSGEGLAKTLLEAASSGLPVITTGQPGCKEAVITGETGLVVEPDNIPTMIAYLRELLDDPGERVVMGMAGRAYVQKHFSDDVVISRMLSLYEKAVTL